MKKITPLVLSTLAVLSTLNPQLSTLHAQTTAFSYQGRLNDSGSPASGTYDLRFTIFDALASGTTVAVSNGLFTVLLDFGASAFPGADRFLELGVRTNGSAAAYTTLAPRQPVLPVPYAIQAANALNAATAATAAGLSGTLPASSLTGILSDARLSPNVALLNGNQTFTGASVFNNATGAFHGVFSGNGAGVTNVNLISANSGGAIIWPAANAGTFLPGSSLAVGANPESVASADVNGDGKLDLISANYSANTLSVLTNNGSGGFGLSSSPAVGVQPYAVLAADVNGDGKPDLISGNFGAGTLTVLTNNGSGAFVAAATVPTTHPFSLAAADVNGDGRPDLIAANESGNTLAVLTNNGSGGFALAATLTVGANPFSVTAADVNGDGKLDLISADYSANTVSVLTNNGSGGFGLSAALAVGTNPLSVVAADVNRGGKPDLICANQAPKTLSVLTNNGSGGFALAATLTVAAAPNAVAAADLNGDGLGDLVSAGGSTLAVFFNNFANLH